MEIFFHWPITRQWRSTPVCYHNLHRFHSKSQSRAHPMCIASFQGRYIWFLHRHKKLETFYFYNFQGWHRMIHHLSSIGHMRRMILVDKMLRSRLESFFHFGIHHRPYSKFQLLMRKDNCFQICCICFSIEKDKYIFPKWVKKALNLFRIIITFWFVPLKLFIRRIRINFSAIACFQRFPSIR